MILRMEIKTADINVDPCRCAVVLNALLLYPVIPNKREPSFRSAKCRVFRTISVRKIDEEMYMSRMNIIWYNMRRIKNSYKKSEQELT